VQFGQIAPGAGGLAFGGRRPRRSGLAIAAPASKRAKREFGQDLGDQIIVVGIRRSRDVIGEKM